MLNLPFQKLGIWQKSMSLAKDIFELTKKLPKEETYALTSQIRRAACSVPSNIAEGSQRGTYKDFAHFLHISKGSLAELVTQIILAKDFRYISEVEADEILKKIDEVSKMIFAFRRKLTSPRSDME